MSNVVLIRGLWGDEKDSSRTFSYVQHSVKIKDSKAYVYGKDNQRMLNQLGYDCELMDERALIYDDNFQHKLDIIEKAICDYRSGVIFVDWHVNPIKELDGGFYAAFYKSEAPIMAALRMYKKRQAKWRKEDQRKVPASDFLYIKDVDVVRDLRDIWKNISLPKTPDKVLMHYVDKITGRWRGVDYYNKYFEIPFLNINGTKEIYGRLKDDLYFESVKDKKLDNSKKDVKKSESEKSEKILRNNYRIHDGYTATF